MPALPYLAMLTILVLAISTGPHLSMSDRPMLVNLHVGQPFLVAFRSLIDPTGGHPLTSEFNHKVISNYDRSKEYFLKKRLN
jgi:hypothetical protein